MDSPIEKFIKKFQEFKGIWGKVMDTQEENCMPKVEESDAIWCNEMDTDEKIVSRQLRYLS